jgi:hypothetical protein
MVLFDHELDISELKTRTVTKKKGLNKKKLGFNIFNNH